MKWTSQLSGYYLYADGYKVAPLVINNSALYVAYRAKKHTDLAGTRKPHKDTFEAISIEPTQEAAKAMCELDVATR